VESAFGQMPDDQGVVDDYVVTLRAELAHRGLGAIDVAEQVGLDHPVLDIERDVLETPEDADAGVVEPNVDPAEPVERPGGEVLDLILLRCVGLDGQRMPPSSRHSRSTSRCMSRRRTARTTEAPFLA
jgi:hypothetical protein